LSRSVTIKAHIELLEEEKIFSKSSVFLLLGSTKHWRMPRGIGGQWSRLVPTVSAKNSGDLNGAL
jgi:hypothetical protein